MEENGEQETKTYTIPFHGAYATVIVVADGKDEDEAIDVAVVQIREYYGWDISSFKVGDIDSWD